MSITASITSAVYYAIFGLIQLKIAQFFSIAKSRRQFRKMIWIEITHFRGVLRAKSN